MKPSIFADAVLAASSASDGHSLAALFAIGGPVAASLLLSLPDPRPPRIISSLRKCSGYLAAPWEDMCLHHLTALHSFSIASSLPAEGVDAEGRSRAERLGEAFDAYNSVVTAFLRYFATLTPGRWALPLLRILCLNLRWLAVQADTAFLEIQTIPSAVRTSGQANKRLEECARQLNKAFTACIADRNPSINDSRKWGTYEIVGLVFKTYFRLKSISLCRNILRAISAASLPELEEFPRSQQVTFRYYVGVLAFLNEEYDRSERELEGALKGCKADAVNQLGLILVYLVPVKLLKGKLPTGALMASEIGSKLSIYSPFIQALQTGDVKRFDQALTNPTIERHLVKKGTYIAIERARDATLRTLLKLTYLSLPPPPPSTTPTPTPTPIHPTRIPLLTLHHATNSQLVGLKYTQQELEWVLATLIYKGYLKGYIAHERGILVLSAKQPFPLLADVPVTPT